jgi:hypothetical protein
MHLEPPEASLQKDGDALQPFNALTPFKSIPWIRNLGMHLDLPGASLQKDGDALQPFKSITTQGWGCT